MSQFAPSFIERGASTLCNFTFHSAFRIFSVLPPVWTLQNESQNCLFNCDSNQSVSHRSTYREQSISLLVSALEGW